MNEKNQTEAENKGIVRSLMTEVFNEKNIEAADEFLVADYLNVGAKAPSSTNERSE